MIAYTNIYSYICQIDYRHYACSNCNWQCKGNYTRQQLETTEGDLHDCIADNASASISKEEYRLRYDALLAQFRALEKQRDDLEEKLTTMQV